MPAALLEAAGVALAELPLEDHHPDFRSAAVKVYVGEPASAAKAFLHSLSAAGASSPASAA